MKKILISGSLILLIFFGVSTITLGAPSVSFGPGLGIPYGVIGGNLEVDFLTISVFALE